MRPWLALLSLVAAPAFAQDLPEFNETFSYEIKGVIDDGLIIESGRHIFYCELDEGPDDAYLFMETCVPVLGPEAAAKASKARMAKISNEGDFIKSLERMPIETLMPAVIEALKDVNCVLNFRESDSEDRFESVVVDNLVTMTGYKGPMSPDGLEEISDIAGDAAEMLIKNGQVVVDRDAGTARLVDCP
ncbi:hypothetical protein ANTHELSMS3_03078 [Antarctobacter heliothermus]|uniref:Uncharacterized protein n=1 Tax=Antarctobacter heliothermus TaxID=74033 RepID=A0A222E6I3_9RHOB|nr:hypothetical protein [Antarctobacter heliothermus]ASP21730.1 hypothetical protein ANTHELSMS3_03078 [Antarctobacter heliothermus]